MLRSFLDERLCTKCGKEDAVNTKQCLGNRSTQKELQIASDHTASNPRDSLSSIPNESDHMIFFITVFFTEGFSYYLPHLVICSKSIHQTYLRNL